jgi:cyclin-A
LFQLRPSQNIARSLNINKQRAKTVPKPLLNSAGGSSFVDDSKNADKIQKENLLAQKKKPIALLRNNVPPSLQNVERNRATACHDALRQRMPDINPNLLTQRLVSNISCVCFALSNFS